MRHEITLVVSHTVTVAVDLPEGASAAEVAENAWDIIYTYGLRGIELERQPEQDGYEHPPSPGYDSGYAPLITHSGVTWPNPGADIEEGPTCPTP